MNLTYKLAMAAGQDAGNRSMRKAGRTAWTYADYSAASDVVEALMATFREPTIHEYRAQLNDSISFEHRA